MPEPKGSLVTITSAIADGLPEGWSKGITSLPPESAAALAKRHGTELHLDDITTLDMDRNISHSPSIRALFENENRIKVGHRSRSNLYYICEQGTAQTRTTNGFIEAKEYEKWTFTE